MMELSEDAKYVLYDKFYSPIYNKLKSKKGDLKENSLFITLMFKTENNIISLMDEFSVDENTLSPKELKELVNAQFIHRSTRPGSYSITAHGIWHIESGLEYISLNKFLDYVDCKKFTHSSGAPLNDEEKVVLFILIALRSFSEETPINRDKVNQIELINAINEEIIFLKDLKVISQKFELKEPKSGEDKITYTFRRMGSIPGKTRNLFRIKDRGNYLSLYDVSDDVISIENLGFLLWLVFGNKLSGDDEKLIDKFCNNILIKYTSEVYTTDEMGAYFSKFTSSKHKSIIKDALYIIPEKSEIWELS